MKTFLLKRSFLLLSIFTLCFFTACSDDDTDVTEISVSSDNLENLELIVGDTYTFTITANETDASDDVLDLAIRWYLNGVLVATGPTYEFVASSEEIYELYYCIVENYSTSGYEVKKAVTLDVIYSISEEDKFNIINDNLYYNEIQLNTAQTFWVCFEDEVSEEIAEKGVKWYVNDELYGTGEEFSFEPKAVGTYTIEYSVRSHYITDGEEINKEAETLVYTSKGLYSLTEPNYTGSETIRGVNSHTYSSSTMERFIIGDYETMGTTNQFLATWAGKIYVIASSTTYGVAVSQFDAETGSNLATIEELPGTNNQANKSFSGINSEIGVVTCASGAYIIELDGLTVNETPINGTESGAENTFVSDGYLYIKVGTSVYVYELDDLSPTSDYFVLNGSISTGFIKTIDGNVWGASGSTLVKFNPRTMIEKTVTLPSGSILIDTWSWKPASWVASTRNNCFFYTGGSTWTQNSVLKYDVDTEMSTVDFVATAGNFDTYTFYGSGLLYDAERDEIACQTNKLYSAYSGLHLFDAQTGAKSYEIFYDTDDSEIYGAKDIFFPCMMSPMKSYE